jgi:hypothetical protein
MTRSRRFRLPVAAVLVTVLFLSLAALATGKPGNPNPGNPNKPAKPTQAKGTPAAAAQYAYGKVKVRICHKGKTITVAQPAVRAHLRHDDTLGPCP